MSKRNDDIANVILDAYFHDKLSPELERKIADWFKADGSPEEKYAALERLYYRYVQFEARPEKSVYHAYEALRRRLAFPADVPVRKKRLGGRIAWRIAAVLLPVLFLLAAGYWFMVRPAADSAPPLLSEVVVPEGSKEQCRLADGSDVWINTGSTIRYAADFADDRIVELEGEAYFSVERDEEHPFIVKTGSLTVEVLGTEFNVVEYPGTGHSIVWVRSGRVEITTGQGKRVLSKGEMLDLDRITGEVVVQPIPAGMFHDWRLPEPAFRNAGLKEIFAGLEAWFGVTLVLDPALNDSGRFDIEFTNEESLEESLFILQTISGDFDYTYRGDTVLITRKE